MKITPKIMSTDYSPFDTNNSFQRNVKNCMKTEIFYLFIFI